MKSYVEIASINIKIDLWDHIWYILIFYMKASRLKIESEFSEIYNTDFPNSFNSLG